VWANFRKQPPAQFDYRADPHPSVQSLGERVERMEALLFLADFKSFQAIDSIIAQFRHTAGSQFHFQPDQEPSPAKNCWDSANNDRANPGSGIGTIPPQCLLFDMALGDARLEQHRGMPDSVHPVGTTLTTKHAESHMVVQACLPEFQHAAAQWRWRYLSRQAWNNQRSLNICFTMLLKMNRSHHEALAALEATSEKRLWGLHSRPFEASWL